MKTKYFNALSLAVIMAMLFTSVGLADQVINTIDNTIDPALETKTIVAGDSTVVGFYIKNINNAGGDPVNSCNVSAGFPATVTFDVPFGVTAVPSSLVFTDCNQTTQTKYVTFSSNTADSYEISILSVTGGRSGGAWDTAPAAFELEVAAPSNTAPSVSVTGVTNSATYNKGSVPVAMCSVIDTEDGNSTFAATLSAITGLYASDGIGSQTAGCSYTDGGGLTATASATYSIVDPSAPSISYTLAPPTPDGSNSWYKSDVALTWTVSEPDSPNSLSKTGCVDQNLIADQLPVTYSCSASSAGGPAGPVEVTIKRDGTLPTITASRTPAANAFGWNNTDVVASYEASDATSGLDAGSPATGSFTFGSEGAGQSHTFTVSDFAGNSASATVSGVNIDKTAPTVSASASPAPNGNGWNNSAVTVSFSGTDALSGIASCDADVVLGSEGAGQSASGSCADKAGNSAGATAGGINIDLTAPSVLWDPAVYVNGSVFYFGFVPAFPPNPCVAEDLLSGAASCAVTGYSAAIGVHTLTATAYDVAGNSTVETRSYEVKGWTTGGFYQPVDMGATVWNTVKGGSTVPFKFEVFAGPTELTDTLVVKSFNSTQVPCTGGTEDTIELTATGGTSLRYDWTSGQFVYNWQTPKKPGFCYKVTFTMQDGSTLTANFKLK